jgi:hypothetical protein
LFFYGSEFRCNASRTGTRPDFVANGWREVWAHFRGRAAYPHQLAFLLLNPLRSLMFSPGDLAARLRLTVNARVLELGPGPGFFSVEIARRIPLGHLCLVDLQSSDAE